MGEVGDGVMNPTPNPNPNPSPNPNPNPNHMVGVMWVMGGQVGDIKWDCVGMLRGEVGDGVMNPNPNPNPNPSPNPSPSPSPNPNPNPNAKP